MAKIVLRAQELDGLLTSGDQGALAALDNLFAELMLNFKALSSAASTALKKSAESKLITLSQAVDQALQTLCQNEPNIQVYRFLAAPDKQPEAARLIAKLRDVRTGQSEFIYYIQRAYELLFQAAYLKATVDKSHHLIVQTAVNQPVQNYAVHELPNLDALIENSVICVMLRAALLPSMIMSKEIQDYSSHGYLGPFALFRIKRDDSRQETDMEYILDLKKSFFSLEQLDGRDWIFADPMNATGGSLVTVVNYLIQQGVKPKSVQIFNVIAALKGTLRVIRGLDNCRVYTLSMDPVLNKVAYILPGLGDAGDRLNGLDTEESPRNIIQLITDFGPGLANLYRSQLQQIEATVLGA